MVVVSGLAVVVSGLPVVVSGLPVVVASGFPVVVSGLPVDIGSMVLVGWLVDCVVVTTLGVVVDVIVLLPEEQLPET